MNVQRATTVDHEALYQDFARLLREHGSKLSALEMLAVAANMVGKLVAMQDQRVVTPEQAMRVVADNIQHGNRQAIEGLLTENGGHA